jgi:hypothetical protein
MGLHLTVRAVDRLPLVHSKKHAPERIAVQIMWLQY